MFTYAKDEKEKQNAVQFGGKGQSSIFIPLREIQTCLLSAEEDTIQVKTSACEVVIRGGKLFAVAFAIANGLAINVIAEEGDLSAANTDKLTIREVILTAI